MQYGIDTNVVMIVMMSLVFVAGLAWLLCWTLVSWFKSRAARAQPWGENNTLSVPPLFEKLVHKALAERDAEQSKLKARVATLEKIVINNHKRMDLAADIDNLNT